MLYTMHNFRLYAHCTPYVGIRPKLSYFWIVWDVKFMHAVESLNYMLAPGQNTTAFYTTTSTQLTKEEYPWYCRIFDTILQYKTKAGYPCYCHIMDAIPHTTILTGDKRGIFMLLSHCGHNSTQPPACSWPKRNIHDSITLWTRIVNKLHAQLTTPCYCHILDTILRYNHHAQLTKAEFPCYCHNVGTILQYNHHAQLTIAEYPCYCHNGDTILQCNPHAQLTIAEYPCYCHNVDTILQYNHHAHCTVDNSWISVLLSQCGYDSTVQPPCTVMTKANIRAIVTMWIRFLILLTTTMHSHDKSWIFMQYCHIIDTIYTHLRTCSTYCSCCLQMTKI